MTDAEDIFQYDPKWPPSGTRRTFGLFTRKEDALILDYLIRTKQYDRLGGNEVWKTMSHSRKFNPSGRSFHGLRERFLKYIMKHLSLYAQVTPQIRARFLKQNPKTIENINSMKSTEELQRDLQPTWSSEDEDDVVSESAHENRPMTPVLRERSQLLQTLQRGKDTTTIATSTPLGEVVVSRKCVPVAESGTRKEHILTLPEATDHHQQSNDSQLLFTSTSSNRSIVVASETDSRAVMKSSDRGSPVAFYFDRGLNNYLKTLQSMDDHSRVRNALQLLQDSLRDAIHAHSSEISSRSFSCQANLCDGTRLYLELWKDLAYYLSKIETFEFRFNSYYLNCFKRVIQEILQTPHCGQRSSERVPDSFEELVLFSSDDLFEYLCCDLSKPFHRNVKKVLSLLQAMNDKN